MTWAVIRFYAATGCALLSGAQSCWSLINYNLGNLWGRLVLPRRIDGWSLTSLQPDSRRVGEDGWTAGEARPALLASVGREPSDAATLWSHGLQDTRATRASRVGEPTSGSDFREERGRGAAKCRKHGSKEGRLLSSGFSREARMAPSPARESTVHCKLDPQLRSSVLRCMLSGGPGSIMEIPDNGEEGQRPRILGPWYSSKLETHGQSRSERRTHHDQN